jgi:hypothetical protein
MDIGMMSGEDVQRIVDDLVDVAPPLLDRLKQAIAVKGAAQLEGKGPE